MYPTPFPHVADIDFLFQAELPEFSIDFTMTLRKFFTFLHKSPWKSMFFPQILVNSSVIPTTFTLPSWNLPLISLTRGLSSLYLIRHKKDVKEQK